MGGCTEETVVVVADIPTVPGCAVLTDCNTVVLSAGLDEAGRQAAYDAWFDRWRRETLKPVA